MGIYYTFLAGLVVWIVLWAIGVKAIDAFFVTIVMLLVAVTIHIIVPFLTGNRNAGERRP